MRMFKSFLARKKRKETKEIIQTLEKRQRAHIKHQKEKGWYCEIEYKSINYANIESGYNKFTPLSYFKDEYIITCSK